MQSNPIYDNLTRNRRPPSVRVTILISVLICVAFTLLHGYLVWLDLQLSVMTTSSSAITSWVALILSGLSLVFGPLMTVILTSINTQRAAQDDSFQLVKLAGISPESIIQGLLHAAIFRLRILWGIAYAMLPPLFVTLVSAYVFIDLAFADGTRNLATSIQNGLFFALFPILCAAVVFTALCWLGLCVGVWLGLKFREMGSVVGAAVAFGIGALILMIPIGYGIVVSLAFYNYAGLLIALLIFGAVTYIAGRKLLEQAERQL